MSVISQSFAFFLGSCLILYYALPYSLRVPLLLCASLAFLLSYGAYALVFILISTLSSYLFALKLQKSIAEESDFVLSCPHDEENIRRYKKKCKQKRRVSLLLSLLPNLGVLSLFKISPLLTYGGLLFPIGLSFYSLRAVSYLCEVYRGRCTAENSLVRFTLYMTYFPLILQGPIARYSELSGELFAPHRADWNNIMPGALRVLYGVFKKLVIANGVSRINTAIAELDGAYVLLLLCLYTAEIYADFSGGVDIMLGISKALGITLPENFDRPFAALGVREYWKRWHITLGEWAEKYVFYPLSLSRPMQRLSRLCRKKLGKNIGKRIPLYTATLAAWAFTGAWHGARANYIVWGLSNALLVLLSQETEPIAARLKGLVFGKAPGAFARLLLTVLGRAKTFLLVGALRLLDLYESVGLTFKRLGSMLCDGGSYIALFSNVGTLLPNIIVPLLGCFLVFIISELGARGEQPLADRICARPGITALSLSALIILILVFGTYGFGFEASDFIYSQF